MIPESDDYPKLGRFQVVNRIAAGGMAEVFLARAVGVMGFQRLVALKLIHANFTRDPEFVKMFIDEARIAMHLHHRNIVQVFDLDQVGETYFIAMEYVHGVNVYDLYERAAAQDRWLDVPLALYIVAELCKGLHFAHTRTGPDGRPMNIVHRDVSPQNVLLSFEGEVKITDFGIATAAERLHHTAAGIVKGKYAYMAPERLEEKPIDGRVDVFSAGVLLYELLTGENPFAGPSAIETIEAVLGKEVDPPSQRGAAVNPKLDAIVLKALAKAPVERFSNAQALGDALTEFAMDMTFARKDMASGDSALSVTLADLFPERARTGPTFADPKSLELPGVVHQTSSDEREMMNGAQDMDAPTVLRMSPVASHDLDTTASNESFDPADDDMPEADDDTSSQTIAVEAVGGASRPARDGRKPAKQNAPDDDGFGATMLTMPPEGFDADTLSPGAGHKVEDPTSPTQLPQSRPRGGARASPGSGVSPKGPAVERNATQRPPAAAPPRPSFAPRVHATAPHEQASSRWNIIVWILGAAAAVVGVIALAAVASVAFKGSGRSEISIRTRPSGAQVRINGMLQPEATPLLAKVSGSGPIVIELMKDGFQPIRKEVQMEPGETLELNPSLVPLTGSIIVMPEPRNAEVFVNDQTYGRGKVNVTVPLGLVTIRVQARGFESQEHTVTLSSEDPKISMRVALARRGR
ncbi:MAG: protein kinase [Myxococcota bacterium]